MGSKLLKPPNAMGMGSTMGSSMFGRADGRKMGSGAIRSDKRQMGSGIIKMDNRQMGSGILRLDVRPMGSGTLRTDSKQMGSGVLQLGAPQGSGAIRAKQKAPNGTVPRIGNSKVAPMKDETDPAKEVWEGQIIWLSYVFYTCLFGIYLYEITIIM